MLSAVVDIFSSIVGAFASGKTVKAYEDEKKEENKFS